MKYEWRKQDKELYLPKVKPQLITVAEQNFISISGKGDPNDKDFSEYISVLYSVAYAIKMIYKKCHSQMDNKSCEYEDYTVFPLEALWDKSVTGKKSEELIKSELIYDLMIRIPDFVTEELIILALEKVKNKQTNLLLERVAITKITDGLSVQILHNGAYDDEPSSFEVLKLFCDENNLTRISLVHREIYLSDARKVEPTKLKTVLRYKVKYK